MAKWDWSQDWWKALTGLGVVGGVAATGLHIRDHNRRRREFSERTLRWSHVCSQASALASRQGMDVQLRWTQELSEYGQPAFIAHKGCGRYIVAPGPDGLTWVLFYTTGRNEVRPICVTHEELPCALAALADAARENYLADEFTWTLVSDSGVVFAQRGDRSARIRRRPTGKICSLFSVTGDGRHGRFRHIADGDVQTLKVLGAKSLLVDDQRALPGTTLVTDRGLLLWDYVEKGDVVVAAARYDGGLFEIAFADDEQRFALSSGPDGFTREELGEGAFAELTSHARTMPRTGSPASRLFTDAFTVRDDEELVGTFESQLAAMQRETQSALAQLKQQHAAEVRRLRQEVASMRREAQQFSQRAQVPTQGTRVSQVNAPSRHSPHTDPTPHAIETEFVVQTPTSPRRRGDLRSLWSQRLREATSELPSTLPNRVSVVAKEVLEAMARIVERGSLAGDVRGDQTKLLRALQDAPGGLTFKPNKRSFGAAIQWIAQHELLVKMISRQEWLINFGQVEIMTP